MTPSARLKATQGLLDDFLKSARSLDTLLQGFFKSHRYAGSSDRRAIQDTVFATVRTLESLKWRLEQVAAPVSGRFLLLAHLHTTGAMETSVFDQPPYGLEALSEAEKTIVTGLDKVRGPLPEHASHNMPLWLFDKFKAAAPQLYPTVLAALNKRAPITLRVNTLKTTRAKLMEAFAAANIPSHVGRLCSTAVHVDKTMPFQTLPGYREGWCEGQDEGSQLAARAVGAQAGEQILELCAGAGGKSLALAAQMNNTGQIFAFDIDAGRLEVLKKRGERAGVRIVQTHRLPEGAGKERESALRPYRSRMDRVVLDVPCSGTGSFRRAPDLRFRLSPSWFATHLERQRMLLQEGATLVKRMGRLVYITCSLLPEENEEQITMFLKGNPEFVLAEEVGALDGMGATQALPNRSLLKGTLLLSPEQSETDGFFIASLRKI